MARRGEIERALFFSRLPTELPSGYERLYFGTEFCQWAFPTLTEIAAAIRSARRLGWAFTLATPVFGETFLPRLRSLLTQIGPELQPGDEILISDFGALPLVRENAPAIPVVLGRTLSGQKRGPQILDLPLAETELAYFRQGRWYAGEAAAFLAEMAIGRIELDNLPQGVAPLPASLQTSLHYPYAMVTSSRNCPFRPAGRDCRGDCGEVFTLASPRSRLPLLQGGNTQFIRLDLPAAPAALGIDRLVFHPHLPR